MGTRTTNYDLYKPSPEEFYDVTKYGESMDIIDAQMKSLEDADVAVSPDEPLDKSIWIDTNDDGETFANATSSGTVISQNADYAEVGEWADGNPNDANRIGYFVAVDDTTAGTTMVKATSTKDVRGVTVVAPAFSGNCSKDKFDENGNLLKQYDFVAVMGLVSVIDNGTCAINGRCMPSDNGTAIPSANNMGYQVIDRIDSTHVLIAVEPAADMIQRIKTDMDGKVNKAGDAMTGELELQLPDKGGVWLKNISTGAEGALYIGNHTMLIGVHNEIDNANNRRVLFIVDSANQENVANGLQLYDVVNGSGKYYKIYGDHNKPSGSYTGNGSATSRTIDTGGIGSAICITGGNVVTFVTRQGGVTFYVTKNTTTYYDANTLKFVNGVLTIATDGSLINANGYTYTYQVL